MYLSMCAYACACEHNGKVNRYSTLNESLCVHTTVFSAKIPQDCLFGLQNQHVRCTRTIKVYLKPINCSHRGVFPLLKRHIHSTIVSCCTFTFSFRGWYKARMYAVYHHSFNYLKLRLIESYSDVFTGKFVCFFSFVWFSYSFAKSNKICSDSYIDWRLQ